jgi:NYN domain/OST-HTH/LOTUS domain
LAKPPQTRLAVLIDADNAPPQIAPNLFKEIAKLGVASVRRIYGDFSGTRLKSWADHLSEHAIVPHQTFAYTVGKNASDIALVIDAMDLLHSGRFDGFCLVSSDSDFTRLASRIREQGVDVFGFGEQKTPTSFRQACKRFFYTETLLPAPPKPPPLPKAIKAPKAVKPPKVATPKAAPAPQPVRVIRPITEAVDLLTAAVIQLAGNDGWTRFDGVSFSIRALAPDFDPKSYGCSKLSALFTKTGQFEMRRDQAKQISIRPLPFWANPPEDVDPPYDREPALVWDEDQEELPF